MLRQKVHSGKVNNKTALAELSQLFDGVTSVSKSWLSPDLKEYKWEIIDKRYVRHYKIKLEKEI